MPENVNLTVPQSIESENALLGAMMTDSEVVADIMDEVSAADIQQVACELFGPERLTTLVFR